MIKNVYEQISGVGIYGLISLSLFFAFFAGMLIWVLLLKKDYRNEMKDLPLQSGGEEINSKNHGNERE